MRLSRLPVLLVSALSALPARTGWADPVPLLPGRAEVRFWLREAQPDIPNAGRVNAIAVRYTRENEVLAGTESGGVFRSVDGGANWVHVDAFGPFLVRDLAFLPGSSDVVLATTGRGFATERGGGIWRSSDGGLSWWRPLFSNPLPLSRCERDAGAYRISFEPGSLRVFVSTECGVAVSDDGGETWIHRDVGLWIEPGTSRVPAVQALGDGRAVAAGVSGVFRTVDGGRRWTAARWSPPRRILSHRALAASPFTRDELYVVNEAMQVFISIDAGDTWWPTLTGRPLDRGCGGVEFIHAFPSATVPGEPGGLFNLRGLDIYLSNRCWVYKSTARRSSRRIFPQFSRAWTQLLADHADTRVLAFDAENRPRFLGSDGGFHVTADGGANWRLSGGSRAGLGALQLYEVTGQQIDAPRRHDLYIGTQDNNVWSSQDGRRWPFSQSAEGFSIFAEPRVAREVDSRINYKRGAFPPPQPAFDSMLSGANFRDEGNWPDAQPNYSDPVLIARRRHIQQTGPVDPPSPPPDPLPSPNPYGLSLTTDEGSRWDVAIESFGREMVQLPKLSRYGSADVVAYQAFRQGRDIAGRHVFKLARVTGLGDGGVPDFVFPAHADFGSLGVTPAQFVWAQVFAVDPQDPMHLIAPDVFDRSMKRSRTGGSTWTPMEELTRLVTADGTRLFTLDLGARDLPFPAVSAVSFCPDDPNLVLVGTFDAGLFLSVDRGETWRALPDTARVGRTMRFHWVNAGTIYVASWGRGLWRLSISIRYDRSVIPEACGACEFFDLGGNPLPQPVFDRAIVLHGGRMSDAKAEQGKFVSMAATPGSLAVLFSDAKGDGLGEIAEQSEPGQFEGLDVARKLAASGLTLRGVALLGGQVAGVIASKEETTIAAPGPFNEYKEEGSPTPPGKGRPYIRLGTGEVLQGLRVLGASGMVDVSGEGFLADPRRPIEFLLDGERLAVKRTPVQQDGTFRVQLDVGGRLLPGLHSIAAIQRVGQQVLMDSSPFGVPHLDGAKEQAQAPPPPNDNP